MKISILSRSDMLRLIENGIDKKTAIISFADSNEDYIDFPTGTNVLKIAFPDIRPYTTPREDYDRVLPQASQIGEFIIKNLIDKNDIICQCDYGISRSAGCAAAIMQFCTQKGVDIFADYRYTPNQFVYTKVLAELKLRAMDIVESVKKPPFLWNPNK